MQLHRFAEVMAGLKISKDERLFFVDAITGHQSVCCVGYVPNTPISHVHRFVCACAGGEKFMKTTTCMHTSGNLFLLRSFTVI